MTRDDTQQPTRRVLIVDDMRMVRETLARILTECGYAVTVAGDGREALAAMQDGSPDVVVLDMSMDGMSGLDVLRHMQIRGIDVPVIAMSGHPGAAEHLARASVGLGAVEFVLKPILADQLEARVMECMERVGRA